MTRQTEVLLPGPAVRARGLALTAPISFWGGVDPKTGRVADPRHPEHGEAISGRAVMIPATVGSSSASAILLELVHAKLAPAAVILHEPDAILLLGLVVAKEMGLQTPIAVRLDRNSFTALHDQDITISETGLLAVDDHHVPVQDVLVDHGGTLDPEGIVGPPARQHLVRHRDALLVHE